MKRDLIVKAILFAFVIVEFVCILSLTICR